MDGYIVRALFDPNRTTTFNVSVDKLSDGCIYARAYARVLVRKSSLSPMRAVDCDGVLSLRWEILGVSLIGATLSGEFHIHTAVLFLGAHKVIHANEFNGTEIIGF